MARSPGFQPGNPLAHLDHLARTLEPEDRRCAGRRRVEALALQQIGSVHTGGGDADAQGTGQERRRLDLSDAQHRLVSGLVDDDGSHDRTMYPGSRSRSFRVGYFRSLRV